MGIEWVVRRASGERYTFDSLARLRMALDNQTITPDDELSFNRDLWRPIGEIPDLRAYFWTVWRRAQRGGLPTRSRTLVENPVDDEPEDNFDEELPTQVDGTPPIALNMQVTMPCFTDEVPRSSPRIIGPDPEQRAEAPAGRIDEDTLFPQDQAVLEEALEPEAPAQRMVWDGGRLVTAVLAGVAVSGIIINLLYIAGIL